MSALIKSCLLLLGLLVLVAAVAVVWPAIQNQRDVASSSKCSGHLSMLSLAMHNYHAAHGHFPPAYVLGPDGKPWHSWRVLLLPDIEQDKLYKDYNFNEPWDGPNNSKLQARMPKHYACPSDPKNLEKGQTNYFVVVGPDTVFPGTETTKLEDVTRPRRQTIQLVEAVGQDVNWMEPRDLSFDSMSFEINDPNLPSISSKHRAPHVIMVDATSGYLHGISPLEVRTMFLIREQPK